MPKSTLISVTDTPRSRSSLAREVFGFAANSQPLSNPDRMMPDRMKGFLTSPEGK
jgi:hypothetical protein